MAIFKNKISKKDQKRFEEIAKTGNPTRALNLFISAYITPAVQKWQTSVKPLMKRFEKVLPPKKANSLTLRITSDTVGLTTALNKLYSKFMRAVYSESVFRRLGITNPLARRAIASNSIAQFKDLTRGALSKTNSTILSNIRSMQTDLITGAARINRQVEIGDIILKEAKRLQNELTTRVIKRHPEYTKMMDNNQFIKYRNGALHQTEEYFEMSTRTSVLNVNRNGVEMQEAIKNRRVSEYFRSDKTPYKTDIRRDVCKEIMSMKFRGKSLVAHDQAAASLFGILTLEQAKARTAFGPNCKHSIKPLPEADYAKIDLALQLSEKEAI